MHRPNFFQITPRHLIFNILAQCKGEISRQELMEEIYKVGSILTKKGYKIPVALKGSKDTGYWNEYIDSELNHWLQSGVISEKEHQFYVFIHKKKPFDDLANVIKILNGGLEKETRKTLERTVINTVQCTVNSYGKTKP